MITPYKSGMKISKTELLIYKKYYNVSSMSQALVCEDETSSGFETPGFPTYLTELPFSASLLSSLDLANSNLLRFRSLLRCGLLQKALSDFMDGWEALTTCPHSALNILFHKTYHNGSKVSIYLSVSSKRELHKSRNFQIHQ